MRRAAVERIENRGVDSTVQRSVFKRLDDRVRRRRCDVFDQGGLVGNVDAVVLSVEEQITNPDDRVRTCLLAREVPIARIDVELAILTVSAERVTVAAATVGDVSSGDLREGLGDGTSHGRIDERGAGIVLQIRLKNLHAGCRGRPRALYVTRRKRRRLDRGKNTRVTTLTDEGAAAGLRSGWSGPRLVEAERPRSRAARRAVWRRVVRRTERTVARRVEVERVEIARSAAIGTIVEGDRFRLTAGYRRAAVVGGDRPSFQLPIVPLAIAQ